MAPRRPHRCRPGAPSDALLPAVSSSSTAAGAAGRGGGVAEAPAEAREERRERGPLTSQSLVRPQSRKVRSLTTEYSFCGRARGGA